MSQCANPVSRFIGCDVGKTHIVVFDETVGRVRQLANEPAALAAFAASLDRACLVVCEATGGYEAGLLAALVECGVPAHRADARKVKAFIRSFGTLAKTDVIDARALARYGRERHASLPLWRAREVDRLRLQAFVLMRADLVADRTAWSNRRGAPGAGPLKPRFDALIGAIDEQIAAIERDIADIVARCEPLGRSLDILLAVKGLGQTTAIALLALMPELGSLRRQQATSLAGLAPHPRQSGKTDAYRPTRGGRPQVKRLLFMAAMAARRFDPNMKAFYLRLRANGKKPLVAITAIMRKLIVIANARLKADALQLS